MFGSFTKTIDELRDDIRELREDARNTPAGRELIRRIEKSDDIHKEHADRIDALEGWRSEFRGMTILIGLVATAASLLVAAHAVGVIP